MRYIHEINEERIISLLTEVFKLYFSSSSLIKKLAVIPIKRKTETLSKRLFNKKSNAHILATGKEYSNLFLFACCWYSLLKNNSSPRAAHAAILVIAKTPLIPELIWLIRSLIAPKGSNKKKIEYLLNPLVKKKDIETMGMRIKSIGNGTT